MLPNLHEGQAEKTVQWIDVILKLVIATSGFSNFSGMKHSKR